ncbi:MAG TPA: DinB family protein [Dehalococcoidia bacterium]|nr:DinB family protein [Dehalococcoidia bacterium]
MDAEIETYSTYIRKQVADVRDALKGLSDEQLNRAPGVEGSNSAYVIATHILGNARAWVLGIACGQPLRRDRPAEFSSQGTYEALAALDPSRLDERLVPSQELWGEGFEPTKISRREALAHVLEHASMHLGQIHITRDLVVAGGSR